MRATGLWAGPRQAVAAERLYADHRADHVAVDVDVADLEAIDDRLDRIVDARVNAEGQAISRAGNGLQNLIEARCRIADDVEDRAEHLFGQLAGVGQFEDVRRDKIA